MRLKNVSFASKDHSLIKAEINGVRRKVPARRGNRHFEEILRQVKNETIPPIAVYEPPELSLEERKAILWEEANKIALQFDRNARERSLAWKVDPDCPAWRMDRIKAVEAWMDEIWGKYYAAVESGATTIGDVPPLPYDFSQIREE